ncbi:MAG: hypothetical protein K0S34_1264 [Bacillales bacterium]|jgi:uncharacterized beta-barrel protein YwiB (DUF1934 family)|nr:hypothetical protein [Bacillales bacterium]
MDFKYQNVPIKTINNIINVNNERQTFVIDTFGSVYYKNGSYFLFFVEEYKGNKIEVNFKANVEKKSFTLKRSGSFKMNHIFIDGEKTTSEYITEYAVFKYTTSDCTVEFNNGNEFRMNYNLELNDDFIGKYETIIKFEIKVH